MELQLLTYAIAVAMQVPSRVCHLNHSLLQYWMLNPLSEARIKLISSLILCWVLNLLSHNRNS